MPWRIKCILGKLVVNIHSFCFKATHKKNAYVVKKKSLDFFLNKASVVKVHFLCGIDNFAEFLLVRGRSLHVCVLYIMCKNLYIPTSIKSKSFSHPPRNIDLSRTITENYLFYYNLWKYGNNGGIMPQEPGVMRRLRTSHKKLIRSRQSGMWTRRRSECHEVNLYGPADRWRERNASRSDEWRDPSLKRPCLEHHPPASLDRQTGRPAGQPTEAFETWYMPWFAVVRIIKDALTFFLPFSLFLLRWQRNISVQDNPIRQIRMINCGMGRDFDKPANMITIDQFLVIVAVISSSLLPTIDRRNTYNMLVRIQYLHVLSTYVITCIMC